MRVHNKFVGLLQERGAVALPLGVKVGRVPPLAPCNFSHILAQSIKYLFRNLLCSFHHPRKVATDALKKNS